MIDRLARTLFARKESVQPAFKYFASDSESLVNKRKTLSMTDASECQFRVTAVQTDHRLNCKFKPPLSHRA